jgi:hypothetical protein
MLDWCPSLSYASSPWMRSIGSNLSPRSTCKAGRHSRMTRNAREWPVPPTPELILVFPLFSFYSNLSRIHKTGDALVFCKLGHLIY